MEAATVAGGSIVRPFFFTFAFVINLLYVNVLCSFNIHCFMHEYMNLKKELRDAAPLRKQRWEEAGRGTFEKSLVCCVQIFVQKVVLRSVLNVGNACSR